MGGGCRCRSSYTMGCGGSEEEQKKGGGEAVVVEHDGAPAKKEEEAKPAPAPAPAPAAPFEFKGKVEDQIKVVFPADADGNLSEATAAQAIAWMNQKDEPQPERAKGMLGELYGKPIAEVYEKLPTLGGGDFLRALSSGYVYSVLPQLCTQVCEKMGEPATKEGVLAVLKLMEMAPDEEAEIMNQPPGHVSNSVADLVGKSAADNAKTLQEVKGDPEYIFGLYERAFLQEGPPWEGKSKVEGYECGSIRL